MSDILARPLLTESQLAAWAAKSGHTPKAPWPGWQTIADLFIAEGNAEGVGGDVAMCQAIHETGWFQFGGDVKPQQLNPAGLGATGGGARGATFPSAQIGIRAQIQHLKRYASAESLNQPCVDPRFDNVAAGSCPTWESLDGHWAVPGNGYGESIVAMRDQARSEMSETWCPFATIERAPYDDGSHGGTMNTPVLGVVEHVTTNSADPDNFFANPLNQASSHFWIEADGTLVEYLPVEVASWAQSYGNYGYWSVETDGTVDVALTDAQVATFGRLFGWLQALPQAGFGATLAEVPGQTGLGWHGMGGQAWGGHTGCPGDIRKAQRPAILAAANPPKVAPMYQPALTIEPVVADLASPTGGAWLLAGSGAVYAFGGAPFAGGANGQAFFANRQAARLELPNDAEKAAGKTYAIIDTAGERYAFPV